ncbi:hypothetical protein ABZ208_08940 [Streptomyces sp. NPDC006208]|uniref:hypothetical protein n=1 Tax=Streptomyces sp. NPDC006208 TaxID=3156734 RepID=UPI00339FC66C
MIPISADPGPVQLATDTGQNSLVALAVILCGMLTLIALCAYLLPRIIRRGSFRAPTLAATLRDAAIVCATLALAVHVYGLMCYLRLENEFYTCGPLRRAAPADFLGMDESLVPVSSVCRWSDGYTHDFVPAFVNPAIATLLALAVIAAGAALGRAGVGRDLARRG